MTVALTLEVMVFYTDLAGAGASRDEFGAVLIGLAGCQKNITPPTKTCTRIRRTGMTRFACTTTSATSTAEAGILAIRMVASTASRHVTKSLSERWRVAQALNG